MNKKAVKTNSGKSFFDEPNFRLMVVTGMWLALMLAVAVKLAVVQIKDHQKYSKIAKGYLEHRRELFAQRGSIVDRRGQMLAIDLNHYSLAVRPNDLADKNDSANKIAKILNTSSARILRKIRGKSSFVYLAHRLNHAQAKELKSLRLKGLNLEKKFSRYYPYDNFAAQTIGYCDFENKANGGLELEFDQYLKGKRGWSIYLRDALGNQFPNLDFKGADPQNGMNIETTIDMVYQSILEEELKKAVVNHNAKTGSAVLLDPRTGEVLGMANYPGYDPNHYNRYKIDSFRNRALTDIYEPGSTFKMVSLAMCVEQLQLNLSKELVFCENGKFPLAQKVVKDHKKFAYLTAQGVFEQSSNIGVIKLAQSFEAPRFYRYARDFGFGSLSGIDLPAEAPGILHRPADYSKYSLSYLSIGYEVAVTPLQIAAAYAAIANDGFLMQPYTVSRIVREDGKVVKENQPRIIRQVVSKETAQRMKEILQGAVENGTGKNARVEGLTIAGKTGTAQTMDWETNSYSSSQHIGSFVGFFPVESPRFVLLLVIHNPLIGYYGSQVAAPAFSNIARRIIGLPVDLKSSKQVHMAKFELPALKNYLMPLEGLKVGEAENMLKECGLAFEVIGSGGLVYRQEPPPFTPLQSNLKVMLYTETKKVAKHQRMPRLMGLTIKEALQFISEWNISVEVKGSGVVVKQFPDAGVKMDSKNKIKLVCKL